MPNALGADRSTARANADAMFDGLADRFDNVQRAPKFSQARSKLGRYALSPSGVYGDTSVWTAVGTRQHAHAHARRYPHADRLSLRASRIRRRAERRSATRDTSFGFADAEIPNTTWDTDVDHAIGSVRAKEVAAALTTFYRRRQQTRESAASAPTTRRCFPRTTRVFGELFSLDTVRVMPVGDGSVAVLVRFRMDPDRIKKTRPNFSKYLDKYVSPARYRLRLQDGRGTTWLDANGSDNVFSISYRVRDGAAARVQRRRRVRCPTRCRSRSTSRRSS